MALEVEIQELLQAASSQVMGRMVELNQGVCVGLDHAKTLHRRRGLDDFRHEGWHVCRRVEAHLLRKIDLHGSQEVLTGIKEHAVDGFKAKGGVVKVDQFDQRVAGRMVGADMGFELFPDGFCSGKGVIAVTHRKEQRRIRVWQVVFLHVGGWLNERSQAIDDAVNKSRVFHKPAFEVTAACH